MGILRRFLSKKLSGRALSLSAALPGARPLCEVKIEAAAEPHADGERVRMRAHLHMRLPTGDGATRDVNSWVELRASDASLDDGSAALLPEKLAVLGLEPARGKAVQTWAGALRSRPGFAMLTLLRLDKERLPAPLRRLLGARPFQVSAAAASVVEDRP